LTFTKGRFQPHSSESPTNGLVPFPDREMSGTGFLLVPISQAHQAQVHQPST